jgi:hypothetical protein
MQPRSSSPDDASEDTPRNPLRRVAEEKLGVEANGRRTEEISHSLESAGSDKQVVGRWEVVDAISEMEEPRRRNRLRVSGW